MSERNAIVFYSSISFAIIYFLANAEWLWEVLFSASF